MTRDQWDALALVIEHGWHGDFDEDASEVYFALLAGYSAEDVQAALRTLLRGGSKFTPKVGEIVCTIEQRHAPPSFDAAWPVIDRAMCRLAGQPDRLLEVIAERAGSFAAGWVAAYGIERLSREPTQEGDYSGAVMHRLRESYVAAGSTEAQRERTIAALTSGGLRLDKTLRKPDYAAALGVGNGGGARG